MDSNSSTPDSSSAATPGVPRSGALRVLGRVVIAIVRILGTILLIGGVIALKVAARQNPAAALPICLAILGGLALIFGATKVVHFLIEDARRERPSPILGAVKLLLGVGLVGAAYFGARVSSLRLGIVNSAPYGWQQTLPYAAALALGGVGILTGGMALRGQRPKTSHKLATFGALLAAFGFVPPALFPVHFVSQVEPDQPHAMMFSGDGRYLAVLWSESSGSATVDLFRTSPPERISSADMAMDPYSIHVALPADGSLLAVLEGDWYAKKPARIILRKASGGDVAWEKSFEDLVNGASELQFSPDGKRIMFLANLGGNGDAATGRQLVTLDAATGDEVGRQAIDAKGMLFLSPTGELIAAATTDENRAIIDLWNVGQGSVTAIVEVAAPEKIEYGARIVWTADGKRLFVGANGQAALFEASGAKAWDFDAAEGVADRDVVTAAFDAAGARALIVLDNNRALVVDAATGAILKRLDSLPIYDAALSGDGHWLATGDLFGDGGTQLWDASAAMK